MGKHKETEFILDKINNLKRDGLVKEEHKIDQKSDGALSVILEILRGECLMDVIGYFKNHRTSSEFATIDNEYKVQDLVYCLLRPSIRDLQCEDPQSKSQGSLTSTRIDFISKEAKIFIEIKFADKNHNAKKVEKEISEDIIKYGKTGSFDYLIFFIFCSGYSFPNSKEFENGFTGLNRIFNNDIQTYCIIKP